jgi:hypothetical protein
MGKKSKRKGAAGGAKNSKTSSRRNRGLFDERNNIQDEASQIDEDESENNLGAMKHALVQGTRVFYNDHNDAPDYALWRRAIIKDIQWQKTKEKTILVAANLVLFSDVVDEKEVIRETKDIERLKYDCRTTDWMLRFKPGTLVVCHAFWNL